MLSKQSLRSRLSMSSVNNRELSVGVFHFVHFVRFVRILVDTVDGFQIPNPRQTESDHLQQSSNIASMELPTIPEDSAENPTSERSTNLISLPQGSVTSQSTSGIMESTPLRMRAVTFDTSTKDSDPRPQRAQDDISGKSTSSKSVFENPYRGEETEISSPLSRMPSQMPSPYLSFSPIVRRNSVDRFHSLLIVDVCGFNR
jgi:hypothetical protein